MGSDRHKLQVELGHYPIALSEMIKTPTQNKGKPIVTQPSILEFVETPDYNTEKNRVPRPHKKNSEQKHPRGSSSNSKTRKRKHSTVQNPDSSTKKIIIDKREYSGNEDPQTHNSTPIPAPTPPRSNYSGAV